MTDKTLPIVLQDTFDQIFELTQQLHEQLTREAAALSRRDSQSISTLAAEKHTVMASLGTVALRLETWLRSIGHAAGDERIEDVLGELKIDGQAASGLTSRWAQIQELSARCKLLNERNGARIELLNLHFKRAMQILAGQNHAAQTYGPDGTATRDNTNRSSVSV